MPFGGNYPSILTLSGWSNVSKIIFININVDYIHLIILQMRDQRDLKTELQNLTSIDAWAY